MTLPAAVRARSVLAVVGSAAWTLGHGSDRIAAPFVDGAGTPVLLVDRDTADLLLEPGRVTAVINGGRLGTLMVSGWPREVDDDEYATELALHRADHAACGPACRGPVAVAVEISHVRITGDHDQQFCPVDLADFRGVDPDPFVVGALPVIDHLNIAHGAELIAITAALVGVPEAAILGVRIADVTPEALVLAMIDVAGSTDHRLEFDRPLAGIDDLGPHLHRLLHDPAGYQRR